MPSEVVALPALAKLAVEGNPLGADIIKAAAEGPAVLKLTFGVGSDGSRGGKEVYTFS